MRSDAAPALSQAIAPTMTGAWTFTPTSGVGAITINGLVNGAISGPQSATPFYISVQSGGAGLTGTGPLSGGYVSVIEGTSGSSAVIDKIGFISSVVVAVNDTSGSGAYGGNDAATVNGNSASINLDLLDAKQMLLSGLAAGR